MREEITDGVRVRVSAVFVPDHSQCSRGLFFFTYRSAESTWVLDQGLLKDLVASCYDSAFQEYQLQSESPAPASLLCIYSGRFQRIWARKSSHRRLPTSCSVRFYLLREEEQTRIYGRAKHSVQLRDRHWILRNGAGGVHNTVTGPGVIGEYPILTPGATAICLSPRFSLHRLS